MKNITEEAGRGLRGYEGVYLDSIEKRMINRKESLSSITEREAFFVHAKYHGSTIQELRRSLCLLNG